MANTLDGGSFKEVWSATMQKFNERLDVFRQICDFSEEQNLKEGDTLNKSYRSAMTPQTYTRGTAVSIRDLTNTNETLSVNQALVDPFYVDDLDELQSSYKQIKEYAYDSSIDLNNWMDGDALGEYDQATSKVGLFEIAGTGTAGDGIGFTLSTSNILKAFSQAKKKLKRLNIFNNLFAVISPDFEATLMEYLAGKDTALGDSTGVAGNIGRFYGFELYVSNACGWSARLEMGSAATAGDTITINGVVFTAAASPTAAGEFDVESTASAQVTTLVTFINAPGTTTSGEQVAFSQANQDLLKGITATDSTTYLTLKAEGKSFVAVSETLTAAADVWTTTKQIQHQLFGQKGAITFVAQKYPTVEIKDVPDKLGKNILPWILYGLKTFNKAKDKLVDVQVRSDAF